MTTITHITKNLTSFLKYTRALENNSLAGYASKGINFLTTKKLSAFFSFILLLSFTINSNAQNVNVNPGAGTYPTLKAAFDAINAGTHTGAVTIDIVASTAEPVMAILNASGVGGANYTSVTITTSVGGVTVAGSDTATIKLAGADNVTIDGRIGGTGRNITVSNTKTGFTNATAIWLTHGGYAANDSAGAQNNIIRNLEIACGVAQNTATTATFGIMSSGTTLNVNGRNNDNNQYIENRIIRCRAGINLNGGSAVNLNDNNTISGNIIGPTSFGTDEIGQIGIFVQFQNSCSITNNLVQFVGGNFANTTAGADRVGIGLGQNAWTSTTTTTTTGSNNTVRGNIIHDIIEERTFSAAGIIIGTTLSGPKTNNLIANNVIYNVRANSTPGDQCVGIGHCGGPGDRIVFNSISITGDLDPAGTTTASTNPIAAGISKHLAAAADTAVLIMNNSILVDAVTNTGTLLKAAIIGPAAGYAFGSGGLNNNDYYIPTPGTNGNVTGITGTGTAPVFNTLANWQTAYSPAQDAASIQADPQYANATSNLQPLSGTPLVNSGFPVSGITTDILNATRNVATPTIGAYENTFVPVTDVGVTMVTTNLAPTQILAVGTTVNLTATVKNFGPPETVVPVFYTVNGGAAVGPVNTVGPIPTTGTENVVFNGANAFTPPSAGTYTIKVYTALAGDASASNDTTTITLIAKASIVTPYVQKFTNPVDWTVVVENAVGTTGMWGLGICTGPNGPLDTAATANCFNASAGRREVLRSPLINLTGLTKPVLHFYAAYRTFTGGENDSMQVLVSTDGGVTFFFATTIYDKSRNSTPSLATMPNSGTAYFPTSVMQWRYETVDLTNVAGLNNVVIGFRSFSQFGNRMWVDDVVIMNADNVCTNSVTAPGPYTCDPDVNVNLLTANASAANLMVTRHNNQNPPFTVASPSIAVNAVATSQNGAIYTPDYIASNKWWHVSYAGDDVTTYIAAPEGHTTFNISIDISSIPCAGSPDSLYILERVDALGPWVALPTTRSGYILTASGINHYGDFAVGGTTYNLNSTIASPTITGATTFCSNSSTTLDAGSGYSAYNWSTGASTQTITVSTAGTFTVTVTNNTGCTASDSVTTSVNPSPSATCSATPVSCFGGNNGTATVTASGGTPGYTYLWSTTATASSIPGLTAGTYTATVTDVNGCTATCESVVTEPQQITTECTATGTTCPGGNNGTASVFAAWGTPPYTYLWSTAAVTSSVSGLAEGLYTVTVTDANGCTKTCETYVNSPSPIILSCSATPDSCFGGINGTASVTASQGEGTPNVTWLWSTGATTSSISGLIAGTYTVTATDPNGCTATCSSVVTQPSQISITETHTDATCGQTNGSINITASGGTPAGDYIDDFNGSNTSASLISRGYVLYRNGSFSGTAGPLWFQGNSSVFPAFNGGPNGYVANNYQAAGDFGDIDDWLVLPAQNITAGDVISFYSRSPLNDPFADSIRVMYNATGNTLPSDVNWTELGRFKVNTTGAWLQNSYNAPATGALGRFAIRYSVISGGLFGNNSDFIGVDSLKIQKQAGSDYSYLWSDGNTNEDRSSLNGGTYTVTVTDGNGCTGTLSVIINFTGNPVCSISGSDICQGDSTQLCAATNSGYLWSTGATTQCIMVAAPGTYTVTVTDANGCTSSCTKTVNLFLVPFCSITGGNFCSGSSTQLCAVTSSSYLWSTGATTQCITINTGGAYTVTVTNASGCTSSCSKTVTEYPKPTCSITGSDFCSGSSTQLCTPLVPAGPLYLYLWSTGATTQCITVTTGGTYTVTVSDANGCTNSCSKTVTAFTLPVCSITGGNFCLGSSTQLCAATNSGYLWSTGATTQCITVNTGGTYTVTVTDANGCTSSCSKTVTAYQIPTCAITGNSSVCPGSTTQICGSTGSIGVYTYLWNTGATTQCITVGAGTYTVTSTSSFGCTNSCSKTITTYTPPVCSITGGDFCSGSSTQLCAATNTGYLWSTGATTQCITVTAGGTYTVTVTDSNGCTSSCSKTVTAYSLPSCSLPPTTICGGSSSQLCAPGGFAGYLWSTGATTQCITVTLGGFYTVTVTNANACTASCSTNVSYTDLFCLITGSNFCQGGSTQLCAPVGFGGYLWSSGATTQCITVTIGGTYTVTVIDANGCTSSCSKTVTAFSLPVCSITGGNFCLGSSTQLCAATNTGYLWSTGATTQCITVTTGGTYTVTVTNSSGCTGSCSKTVTAFPPPPCSITGLGSVCPGNSAQWCAPIGTLNYLWSVGATTQCIVVSTAGTYTVTVIDVNGCSSSCSKTLTIFTPPTCSITGGNFCQGSSTQLCAATNSGYLWSSGATTQCITVTIGGTYTVTVIDANGCTSSCSKTVTAFSLPVCSITGGNFCLGSSTQLCAATNTGYLWSTGATTQCITVTTGGTYTVTVTNSSGCTGSCSKTVTAFPPPPCSITGLGSVCPGNSAQWCAPIGTLNYLWSVGATTQCIVVSTAGTYTVTVIDVNGCSSSCSKTLTIFTPPTCSITGGNFCQGSSTQLCAATNSGYLWSSGATTQCITVTIGGTYTVTVIDANGCTSSCSKTITTYPVPVCSITGSNFCQGSSTQLCAATNSGYLWSTGATTQCITVNTSGTYTVTVTNANGCTGSCSKTVTAYPLPTCSISGNIAYCEGSTTQLCGTPGMNAYLWNTGATTQCIAAAGGDFTVTVTDANGCTSSCSITTHLRLLPVCSITGGNFCAGNSTQLCATLAPVGYVFSYAWSTGATTQCITVTTGGTYTVNITNQYGCSSSCSKTITVYPVPVCTISGNIAYCQGSTTQLCGTPGMTSYLWNTGATTQCIAASGGDYTVTVTNSSGCTSSCSVTTNLRLPPVCSITGGNFCAGSSSQLCAPAAPVGYVYSYSWSTGATTQCITISTGGNYTVTISNQYGCTSSCSKAITKYPLPTCSITGTASVCPGSSAQWCAPAGLAAYLWSNGATTQCITVSTAATYTVTVTNTNGCTKSCSKTLTIKGLPNCTVTGTASVCPGSATQWCAPEGLAAYLWSNGATTQCITVSVAGTYTVTVTNTGGCTKSCSKTLTIKGVPNCNVSGAASICPGGATQWCAPAGLAAYLWNTGATTQCISVSVAGVYTVTTTNAGGCTSSCIKTLTIKTPPSCAISGGNICQGGSTQLCASANAAGYLWNTGATTKCITVSTAGIYTITVTGTNGCTSSCSKNVTVSSLPNCAITWNHAVCQGSSAQFCAPAGLSSYLWNTGATTQCVNIGIAGDYTVTVSNTSGCTNSCTIKVVVYAAPACSITGNSVVSPGQTTPICAPAGLTYLWNNGATTQCRNVAAGTYTVTVTNANGCTSSCSKTVTSAAKMVEPVVIGGDNGAIEASAYPNPFNEEATIEFRNTIASGHVVIELFNLTGSKMAVLFDKDVEQNVTYQTKVHSEDLAEGVYFYRIVSGDNVITGKLILLKD